MTPVVFRTDGDDVFAVFPTEMVDIDGREFMTCYTHELGFGNADAEWYYTTREATHTEAAAVIRKDLTLRRIATVDGSHLRIKPTPDMIEDAVQYMVTVLKDPDLWFDSDSALFEHDWFGLWMDVDTAIEIEVEALSRLKGH